MPSNPFYVPDSGVLYCEDCAPDDASEQMPSETDSPSHCDDCGALLAESLTSDGVRYVVDALTDYIRAAVFTGADGRKLHGGAADTLDDWRAEYSDDIERFRGERDKTERDGFCTATHGGRIATLYDAIREREQSRLSVLLVEHDGGYGRQSGTDADGAAWTDTDGREDGEHDTCADCGAAVHAGWLCLDGGEIVCASHVLTPQDARSIAADWHTGQTSALYALASSGAVLADARFAIERELSALDVPRRTREERIARSADNVSWRPFAYRVPRMPINERWHERMRLRALADWTDGVRSRGYADAALEIRELVRDERVEWSDGYKLLRIAEILKRRGLSDGGRTRAQRTR